MSRSGKSSYTWIICCLAVSVVAFVTALVIAIVSMSGAGAGDTPFREESEIGTESEISSEDDTSSEDASSEFVVSQGYKESTVSKGAVSFTEQQVKVIPDGSHVCYLTFDDGPSKTITPKILDILKENEAKATFFVVGTGHLELLEREKNEGHTIGLHAYQHEYSVYKSADGFLSDLQKLSDIVYDKTGIRSNIMRFPGGSSNTVSKKYCKGVMTELTNRVTDMGYVYVDWDVDSTDAEKNGQPVETIINNVKKYSVNSDGTAKKDAICILMHDTDAKKTTAEALPEIIKMLRNAGYTFECIDSGSPEFHHGINN